MTEKDFFTYFFSEDDIGLGNSYLGGFKYKLVSTPEQTKVLTDVGFKLAGEAYFIITPFEAIVENIETDPVKKDVFQGFMDNGLTLRQINLCLIMLQFLE